MDNEIYCFNWYKQMYLKQGFPEKESIYKAKIDLNYQKALYQMCELFSVNEK